MIINLTVKHDLYLKGTTAENKHPRKINKSITKKNQDPNMAPGLPAIKTPKVVEDQLIDN